MAELKKALTLRFWVHMILLAAVFILVSGLLAGTIVFTIKGLLITALILGVASIALEFILDAVGLKK